MLNVNCVASEMKIFLYLSGLSLEGRGRVIEKTVFHLYILISCYVT